MAGSRGDRTTRPWPLVVLLVAGSWYLLVGGTWLLAELVAPVEGGAFPAPLALPLLPAQLVRLADAALAASVVVAVLVRRPVAVVVGTVAAAGGAAVLTVRTLRGSAEDFWSDPRLLVPELVVLGLATAAGLVLGSWAGRRPPRLAVALAVVSPTLLGLFLSAAGDVARTGGGGPYDVPAALGAFEVVVLAAVALAGALLARYRRWAWLALVAPYLVVAAIARGAVAYGLGAVHVGMPQRVDDLVGSTVDVLPVVAAAATTWSPLVALALGVLVGVLRPRAAEPAPRPGPGSRPERSTPVG